LEAYIVYVKGMFIFFIKIALAVANLHSDTLNTQE